MTEPAKYQFTNLIEIIRDHSGPSTERDNQSEQNCGICLDTQGPGQWCTSGSECKISFHNSCLAKWIDKTPAPGCPHCRRILVRDRRQKFPTDLPFLEQPGPKSVYPVILHGNFLQTMVLHPAATICTFRFPLLVNTPRGMFVHRQKAFDEALAALTQVYLEDPIENAAFEVHDMSPAVRVWGDEISERCQEYEATCQLFDFLDRNGRLRLRTFNVSSLARDVHYIYYVDGRESPGNDALKKILLQV